jgi:hypothetical protein
VRPAAEGFFDTATYCGLFKTPSLRNVATRKVFFHNGIFHSLREVMHFYVERETNPAKWYPRLANGEIDRYNDLPPRYKQNIDIVDAPFDRKEGDEPALNDVEIDDVIAFLKTLTDGYRSEQPDVPPNGQQGEWQAALPVNPSIPWARQEGPTRPGRAARTARANKRAADLAPIIAELQAGGITSKQGIAAALNERGIQTPRGSGRWYHPQVGRLLARLKGDMSELPLRDANGRALA